MKTAKTILQTALKTLKGEGRRVWIKGYDAGQRTGRKFSGVIVDYRDEEVASSLAATGVKFDEAKGLTNCYCARGLIRHIGGNTRSADKAMRVLAEAIPTVFVEKWGDSEGDESRVVEYNDFSTRTFPQMIKWFEKAVRAA